MEEFVNEHSVLLRITTKSALERGADISFLSCYPAEREWLFPPLCYLQPVAVEPISIAGRRFQVGVVEPRS